MNNPQTAYFIEGCKLYIEGKFTQALEAFNYAREIEPTVHIDMWRARAMMDSGDYFKGMQLLQWMVGEYNNDPKIHSMISLVHIELMGLQPTLAI